MAGRMTTESVKYLCVYGVVLNQAKQKYDELVYEMFVEVFRYIPLFTLVNESVFIVHGGKRRDRMHAAHAYTL